MSHNPSDEQAALSAFREMLDLDAGDRQARLDALPGPVRARVHALLDADARSDALDAQGGLDVLPLLAAELGQGAGRPVLPERLGAYRITGLLGAGGMGVVYEAEQEHPKRRVAIKVLHPEFRRFAAERFRSEANALGALAHPNIPQLFEAGEADGVSFLAMECVEGVRLDLWAPGQRAMDVLELMVSVCDAVGLAHRRGLVHCDLKPHNVLVTVDGLAKVMDFGLATVAGSREPVGAGTPTWMAPEMARGEPPTPASDVFSLGRMVGVLVDKLPWPWRVDLGLVVAKATAEDPNGRYTDAAALSEDLVRVMRSRPVAARTATPPYRLQRWSWRNRGPLRALAASGVVVGTVLIAVLGYRAVQASRLEAAAGRRLATLESTLDEQLQAGAYEDAVDAVRAAVATPGFGQTRAAGEAWLKLAFSLSDRRAHAAERVALAEAYVSHADVEDEVLAQLVEHYAARWDVAGLERVTAELRDRGQQTERAEYLLSEVHRDALGLARRAPADVQPVLQALSRGTRTPHQAWAAEAIRLDGESVVFLPNQEQGKLTFAQRDAELSTWAERPFPAGWSWGDDLPRIASGSPRMLAYAGDERSRVSVFDLSCTRRGEVCLEPVPGPPIPGLTAVRGDDELLIGEGPSPRLVRWRRDAEVSEVASSDLMAASSMVRDLLPWGDDLAVAAGPWRAFDVRLLHRRGTDWTTRARLRLGAVRKLGVLASVRGRRLVAAKTDAYAAPKVFSRERPYGEPAGLYLLRDDGDALTIEQTLFPDHPGPTALGTFVIGDFDGDGLQDIASLVNRAGVGDYLWLLRALPDGGFAEARLRGVVPMAALQLDADPADELVVRVADDEHHTWVLGAGDTVPPQLVSGPSLPEPSDVEGLGRAKELARIGLVEEAADFAARGVQALDEEDRVQVLEWVGHLRASIGDDRGAAEALTEALRIAPSREALKRAVAEHRRRALDVSMDGGPRIGFEEGELPGPEWEVRTPASVRLSRQGVRLDMLGEQGAVLSTDLDWTGPSFRLAVDVSLEEVDSGGGVEVRVFRGDDLLLSTRLVRYTGDGSPIEEVLCGGDVLGGMSSGRVWPSGELVPSDQRYALEVVWDVEQGRARCAVTAAGTTRWTTVRQAWFRPDGPLRIEIRGPGKTGCRSRVVLHRASLTGSSVEGAEEPLRQARRELALGRASAVQAQLDLEAQPVLGLVASAVLGDRDGIARSAAALPDGPLPSDVAVLLRQRPSLVADALHERFATRFGELALGVLPLAEQSPIGPLHLHPGLAEARLDTLYRAERWALHGRQLLHAGLPDRAGEVFQRLLTVSEGRADQREARSAACRGMAEVLLFQDRPEEAARWLRRALEETGDQALLRDELRASPTLAPLLDR